MIVMPSSLVVKCDTNKLFDTFKGVAKFTKSHILAMNAPVWTVVLKDHAEIDQSVSCLKCGRTI